jgi:DNA primase
VCGKGTDAIGWLQESRGLTFTGAVLELAGRYGIPLPEKDPEAAAQADALRKQRQRLLVWREKQQEAFHQALLDDIAAQGPAWAYLQERGLTPQTAITWGLGLNARRLMLPIIDAHGRCCGFSGRTLADEESKYRNSPGDALFCKHQLLFGLHQAADAIRRSGEALLVEGPLDVIQLHQAGFPMAVAAMGTSLSPGAAPGAHPRRGQAIAGGLRRGYRWAPGHINFKDRLNIDSASACRPLRI